MVINGIKYNFYELLDEEYGLAVATDRGVVLTEHLQTVNATDGVDIYEVPYEYAKRKYELNPHIINYCWLKGLEFDDLVRIIVNDNEDNGCFILFDGVDSEE